MKNGSITDIEFEQFQRFGEMIQWENVQYVAAGTGEHDFRGKKKTVPKKSRKLFKIFLFSYTNEKCAHADYLE